MDLTSLDVRFGALPRYAYPLTDHTGRLQGLQLNETVTLLKLFHRKFPQSLFSAFLIGEVVRGTISEYTFWIANRALFNRPEAVGSANFDLLLGLDLGAGAACLTIGYGLEPYLTEQDLEEALAAGAGAFRTGKYATGIRSCADVIIDKLREIVRRLEDANLPGAAAAPAAGLLPLLLQMQPPRPIPLGWKVVIGLGGTALIAVVLYISARIWRAFNLFDREYRLPEPPEVPLRLGGSRSGGCMATIKFRS